MGNYLYVVTFSPLGEDRGEFFREEAFISEAAAEVACFECMNEHGGLTTYHEEQVSKDFPHICRQWDGYGTTVWLEKLIVRDARGIKKLTELIELAKDLAGLDDPHIGSDRAKEVLSEIEGGG